MFINRNERNKEMNNYFDKFYSFRTVPFGLSFEKTQIWIKQYIIDNELKGIGELH